MLTKRDRANTQKHYEKLKELAKDNADEKINEDIYTIAKLKCYMNVGHPFYGSMLSSAIKERKENEEIKADNCSLEL